MNYTYIVECQDNTLYTGWTNNIRKRLLDHNSGKGAKYTRGRAPITLVYLEIHKTKQEAMSREYAIKRLTKVEKLRLIQSGKDPLRLLDSLERHAGNEEIHENEVTDTSPHNK